MTTFKNGLGSLEDSLGAYIKNEIDHKELHEEVKQVAGLAEGPEQLLDLDVVLGQGADEAERAGAKIKAELLLRLANTYCKKADDPLQSPGRVEASFKQKLKDAGIRNPRDEIVTRCMMTSLDKVRVLCLPSTPVDDARFFYEDCTFKIGSRTFGAWVSEAEISVNGCWMQERPTLLTAVHLKTGRLHVLKVLPRHTDVYQKAALGEKHALKLLGLDKLDDESPLVKMEHLQLRLDKENAVAVGVADSAFAGAYECMKMRRYAASLEQLPQLSQELIATGGRRILEALKIMHSGGLIHCDVKAANVFVTEAGSWHLGDYGASVPVGDQVWSCTQQWFPDEDVRFKKAEPRIDFGMLLVMLAAEVDKKKLGQGLLAPVNGLSKATFERVRETCKQVVNQSLRNLLGEVAGLAGFSDPFD